MKKLLNCLIILLSITGFSCTGQERPDYKVLYVYDGDTMSLLTPAGDTLRVRLDGVDCPEMGMDYSIAAKWYTDSLANSGPVSLKVKGVDRYGRTLAEVLVYDTVSINLSLLQRGLAWHYKNYNREQRYAEAEQSAKATNTGLWSVSQPVPPWVYRARRR